MGNAFDIRLESLANPALRAPVAASAEQGIAAPARGTFYLETFGCQMNEHDSEKVAGLLVARGYQQVETVEAAGLILYNTCSIREKAAQKVFSRFRDYRGLNADGRKIAVLGCVAQHAAT